MRHRELATSTKPNKVTDGLKDTLEAGRDIVSYCVEAGYSLTTWLTADRALALEPDSYSDDDKLTFAHISEANPNNKDIRLHEHDRYGGCLITILKVGRQDEEPSIYAEQVTTYGTSSDGVKRVFSGDKEMIAWA